MPLYECDGCGIHPIFVVCWQCNTCEDYHLCNECKDQGAHTFSDHSFTALKPEPNHSIDVPEDIIVDDPQSTTQRRLKNNYTCYQKLDAEKKEIRLVQIVPGLPGDILSCMIGKVAAPWDDTHYSSVSYCWGDFRSTRTIRVAHVTWGPNGVGDYSLIRPEDFKPFQVTRNLYDVLCRIRCNPETCEEGSSHRQWFWIDAISINQGDLEERSQQVTLIGDIYSRASRVEVFLNAQNVRDFVGRFVTSLSNTVQSQIGLDTDFSNFVPEIHELMGRIYMVDKETGEVVGEPEIVKELAKIFRSRWFRRVWVLQEVYMAKKGAVHIRFSHDMGASWEDIVLAFNWYRMSSILNVRENFFDIPTLWAELSAIRHGKSISEEPLESSRGTGYTDILQLFRRTVSQFQATDPKDKLYAIIGLSDMGSNHCEAQSLLTPNYEHSTSMVYAGFTKACVRQYKNLDVLNLHHEITTSQQLICPCSTCLSVSSCIVDGDTSNHPSWALWPHAKVKWTRGNLVLHADFNTASSLKVDSTLISQDSDPFTLSLRGFCLEPIDIVLPEPAIGVHDNDPEEKGWNITGEYIERNAKFRRATANFWAAVRETYQQRCDHHRSCPAGCAFNRDLSDEELFEMFLTVLLCRAPENESDGSGEKLWRRPGIAESLSAHWKHGTTDPAMELLPQTVRGDLQQCYPTEDAEKLAGEFSGMAQEASGRVLFFTRKARLGLCPLETKSGDRLVALFGGKTPYILRKVDDDERDGKDTWKFVGECYVHGLMDGNHIQERVDEGATSQVFDLR